MPSFSGSAQIKEITRQVKEKLAAKTSSVMAMFHSMDKDHSQQLSRDEFAAVLKDFGIVLPAHTLNAFIAQFESVQHLARALYLARNWRTPGQLVVMYGRGTLASPSPLAHSLAGPSAMILDDVWFAALCVPVACVCALHGVLFAKSAVQTTTGLCPSPSSPPS